MKKNVLTQSILPYRKCFFLFLFIFSFFLAKAQPGTVFFRDDFNRTELGPTWEPKYAWSIYNNMAYSFIDGTGGLLQTSVSYPQTSYIIETSAKGFTVNYWREFRIIFGKTSSTGDSAYVLSYTPYSGGQLRLSKSIDNVYYPQPLDEIAIYPNLNSTQLYKFKIAKYTNGLIQVYLDKGTGYSSIPLLEAIDNTYQKLGHFGWQVDTQTYAEDFFVDWIEAKVPAQEKTIKEKPAEDSQITQVSAESSKSYKVAKLEVGVKEYTDRTYTITSVPSYLQGASFIQTANDDKTNTSTTFLTLFVKSPSIVYIGYDPRATRLPSWLQSWTKTGDRIGTTDIGSSYLDVYSKKIESGYPSPLILGGNLASPAAGSQMNYLVAAVPVPPTARLEAENAVISGAIVSNKHLGYSGTGFVDYVKASNEYIEWTVETAVPGVYTLGFAFSNGSTTNRSLNILLDGTIVSTEIFSNTHSWDSWAGLFSPKVYLTKGTHKIRATSTGTSGPNIDYLSVSYSNSSLSNQARISHGDMTREINNSKVSTYPNPFNQKTTIYFKLEKKSIVNLSLLSLQGQSLKILINGPLEAGEHQAEVSGDGLKEGLYLYQLKVGGSVTKGKLIKK